MNILRIKHFEEIDKENMQKFFNYGEIEGTCVICGEKCYNDEAYSNKGHKWTCSPCTFKLAWYLGEKRSDILKRIWS